MLFAQIGFYKNGSTTAITLASTYQGADNGSNGFGFPLFKASTLLTLVANDYIEVKLTNMSIGSNPAPYPQSFPFYTGGGTYGTADAPSVQVKAFLISAATPNINYFVTGTIPNNLNIWDTISYSGLYTPSAPEETVINSVLPTSPAPNQNLTNGTQFTSPSGGLNKFKVTATYSVKMVQLTDGLYVYLKLYVPSTATYYSAYNFTFNATPPTPPTNSNIGTTYFTVQISDQQGGQAGYGSFTDFFNLGATTIPAGTLCYLQLYAFAGASGGPSTTTSNSATTSKVSFFIENLTTL